MKTNFEFLDVFGKAFVPEKIRPNLNKYLVKAGIHHSPFKFFGAMFYVVLIITLICYLLMYSQVTTESSITIAVLTLGFWIIFPSILSFIIIMLIYFYLNIRVYNRTKEVEAKLPDYLQLVSTNLRSGMSFEKSLWFAIRPKFGILADEISEASKKVMTGSDISDALRELSEKYESPILIRTMDLIISEMKSGGEIAIVIDRIIKNLKETTELKEEMSASVVTYVIFIAVIVVVLAPVLFALSQQLLNMLIGVGSGLSGAPIGGDGIDFNKLKEVDMNDFKFFSYLALGVISSFASMITSIISRGDIKSGLKYIPIYLVLSLIIYTFASNLLSGIF